MVSNIQNRGVLPIDTVESQLSAPAELTELSRDFSAPAAPADHAEPAEPAEHIAHAAHAEPAEHVAHAAPAPLEAAAVSSEELPQEEYTHVRYPRVRRSSALIVMSLSALCGVIGGIVISRTADVSAEMAKSLAAPFGKIFLERTLLGAAFLGAEFILGFFALGDLLVWIVPLAAGLGSSLRVAATKAWILLPSSILLLFITAFGAAVSAGFSETLMTIARGGTVHLGSSPRKIFALNFLGYLAAVIACALYEGIILNV